MKLSLAFSPCPNDTFIFDALVNGKIDTEGLEFDVFLEDVQTLNEWALEARHDITKLSFPAFFNSSDNYTLLNAGSALGKGVGPLVISKNEEQTIEFKDATIALPGENTTANFLFSFAYPEVVNKKFMVFSQIEEAVLSGGADYGVIIHENRFTYREKGLYKIRDLGEYWEEKKKLPIPLGGIAARRTLGEQVAARVDRLIRKSLEYSFDHYPTISTYVKQHSQEMSEDVMKQHIDLYVNNYSIELGAEGQYAIRGLHEVYKSLQALRKSREDIFLQKIM